MNFDYHLSNEDLFFDNIKNLPLEKQVDKLKMEIKIILSDNKELLKHINFLNSQISKYCDILNNGN